MLPVLKLNSAINSDAVRLCHSEQSDFAEESMQSVVEVWEDVSTPLNMTRAGHSFCST